VKSTKQGDKLVIEATNSVARDDTHDYELWALPEGGAPVSLGLLPKNGIATLALNEAQRAALGIARKIAVSVEPLRGSPTGAPTGPVIHVTDVTKLS
jgi:anti-sigma-K factor RskA